MIFETPDWLTKIWDGTLQNAIPLLFIAFLSWRVSRIEAKIAAFATTDMLKAVQQASQREQDLQARAQDLALAALENRITALRQ